MALSIIRISEGYEGFGLYDSDSKEVILKSSKDDLFEWKHTIEQAQQAVANRDYMNALREERVALLVSSGNTKEEAELFLMKQMPYLYENIPT